MLVDKQSTSKLAIFRWLHCIKILSKKVKNFLTVNLCCVILDTMETECFAR